MVVVTDDVAMRVQEALTQRVEKQFDGDAYFAGVSLNKFAISFFPNDRDIVGRREVRDFLDDFTVKYEGERLRTSVIYEPESNFKYTFVVEVLTEDDLVEN